MSIKLLFKIQVLTLALSALVSCSTLNKNECLNADWSTIGYQDGFQGKLRSRIAKHRKACTEYGVKPILDQYLVGYEEGLVEYCQPARGYRRGLLGYNNKQLCNGAPHKPYTDAYRYGYDIYIN